MRGYTQVATSSSPGEKTRAGPSSLISTLSSLRSRRPFIFLLVVASPALLLVAWLGHGSILNLFPVGDAIDLDDGDAWPFVDRAQRERGLQRLSWGALQQQGAKGSIKANLKDDRAYMFTIYGAG